MLWLDLQGFVIHSGRGYEGPFSTLLRVLLAHQENQCWSK